jgi:hypothetical protein
MGQIACLACVVFALLPSAASAAGDNCNAPPGTSGIDQYCEVLPGAGGTGGSHHKKQTSHVSPKVTQTLQHQGSAGAAILQLAQQSGAATQPATKPDASKQHKTRHHHKTSATTVPSNSTTPPAPKADTTTRSAPANDPVSAVGNAVSVGSGVGAGFVWLLVGIGLVFGGMAWMSYRRRLHESA